MAGLLARLGLRSQMRTAANTDTPPAGQRALLARADGWWDRTSDGTEVPLGTRVTTSTNGPETVANPRPGDIHLQVTPTALNVYRFA